MTLEKLRAALAAATTAIAIAGASCAHDRPHHKDTIVAGRQLGDSTASPGADPDRPVARSVDTQEVSTTISRVPSGPVPAPSPSPAGTPAPYPMPPQQVPPPVAIPPVATPPPASPTSPTTRSPTAPSPTTPSAPGPAGTSPGAFAPPPPPPR